MMGKKAFSVFLVLAGALGFSCGSTAENSGTIGGANAVMVDHSGLGGTVQLMNFLKRQNNGLLEVQVDLKNESSSDVSVEYTFEWLDAQGFKMDSAIEHWTPVTLNGKHVHVVTAIAPRPGADKFKIHVRAPHEVKR